MLRIRREMTRALGATPRGRPYVKRRDEGPSKRICAAESRCGRDLLDAHVAVHQQRCRDAVAPFAQESAKGLSRALLDQSAEMFVREREFVAQHSRGEACVVI